MQTFKRMMSIITGAFVLAMLIAGLTYADNEPVKILDAEGQAIGAYETLDEAYSAVQNGQTIQLQQDIDLGAKVFACNAGRSFTLDLNGKTLKGGYSAYSGYLGAVEMSNGGSLTITDSTDDKAGEVINPSTSGGNGIEVNGECTLTLEAGTIRASYDGISSGYSRSKVIINGGTVIAHSNDQPGSWAGVSAYGGLTVGDGAVITGDRSGIRVSTQRSPSSGTITVNGGKITGTAGPAVINSGTISIHGGVFKGSEACLTSWKVGDGGDPVFNISGGWYSDKVNDSYVAEGYTATDARPESERPDEGAPYTVVKKVYNLYVGGVHVNSQNQNDVLGDGSGSVKYDPETNTITLNNATIEMSRRSYGYDAGDKNEYGIRANMRDADSMPGGTAVQGPVTIKLIGDNKIVNDDPDSETNDKYGICVPNGNIPVSFTGGGSLSVSMKANEQKMYTGIETRSETTFDGVKVSVSIPGKSKTYGFHHRYARSINLKNGSELSIKTGSNSESYAVYNTVNNPDTDKASIDMEEGTVLEAFSSNQAIYKSIAFTDNTKVLGASVNTDPIAVGVEKWDGITDLSSYKYVRIPYKEHVHVWDEGVIIKKATTTEVGKIKYTCKECLRTRVEDIPKLAAIKTTADIPARTMKVTWNKMSGAVKYRVAYRLKGGKWKTKTAKKTSYTIKGMKKAKYYEFKVAPVFKDGKTGEYSEVSYRFFRAVKGKAKGVKGGAKLTWSKEPKANGYIAYCSTSKQFKSYKEAELKGKNKKSYTFKGLKKGKTYYVIVRSYINKGGKKYLGITYPVKKVKAK